VLSTETVRSHVKNILRKLKVRSREEAVAAAASIAGGRHTNEEESTRVEKDRRRGRRDRRRSGSRERESTGVVGAVAVAHRIAGSTIQRAGVDRRRRAASSASCAKVAPSWA
jgi:hypothetical protein